MKILLIMLLLISMLFTLPNSSIANGIVYVEKNHIYNYDFNTKIKTKLTEKGRNLSPKVSPDGKHIAFQAIREGHSNYEIYIMKINGEKKGLKRITYGGSQGAIDPIWSNNGNEIYYYTVRNTVANLDINKNITGYNVMTLNDYSLLNDSINCKTGVLNDYNCKFCIIPSPNGKYHLLKFNKKIALYDITNKKVLLEQNYPEGISSPAWSKNSENIAFINLKQTNTVLVLNVVSVDFKSVLLDTPDNYECGASISWSNDGNQLAMSCFDVISEKQSIRVFDFKHSEVIASGSSVDWY